MLFCNQFLLLICINNIINDALNNVSNPIRCINFTNGVINVKFDNDISDGFTLSLPLKNNYNI